MKFDFTLADGSQAPLLMPARWFTDLGGKPLPVEGNGVDR